MPAAWGYRGAGVGRGPGEEASAIVQVREEGGLARRLGGEDAEIVGRETLQVRWTGFPCGMDGGCKGRGK